MVMNLKLCCYSFVLRQYKNAFSIVLTRVAKNPEF